MPNEPAILDSATLGVPPPPVPSASELGQAHTRRYDLRADPAAEYVAHGYYAPLGDYVRTLPEWIDPVQRDYGLDVYLRMVETDPQVASCLEVYKAAVLADGWRLTPAAGGDDQRDFCADCLDGLARTPFDLFLRQMLDAVFQGHKVAERVYRRETDGRWAGRYVIDRLKVKPHRSTAFVMDAYENTVGLLGLMPNLPMYGLWPSFGYAYGGGFGLAASDPDPDALQKLSPALLPLSKFCVLTWDGQDGSPQGRSMFRRIFTPWWWKQNGYAIWGAFIQKHADPSIVATAGPNAGLTPHPLGLLDAHGNPIQVSPVAALDLVLGNFRNGSKMALPYGATVQALDVANNGEAVAAFMEYCDKQIAKGILGQTLATEEGKYGTKGQGAVHGGVKDDVTRAGQIALTAMVQGLLSQMVVLNWGPQAAALTPAFGLGQEETMDFAAFATGAAAIGYSVAEEQFPEMDAMGGVPVRDAAAWAKQVALRRKQQEQAAALPNQAADGTPGDAPGEEGAAGVPPTGNP